MSAGVSQAQRYGSWALVLGGSEGLGLALARSAAYRGFNVIITGRRAELLNESARSIISQTGRDALPLQCDLSDPAAMETLKGIADNLEIGLLVYNAAYAPTGPFLDLSMSEIDNLITINISHVLKTIHYFGSLMKQRGKGGILLMGSLASLQGSGWLAGYAASKSFIRIFGESLWAELAPAGIRVLTCLAGATSTPNFKNSGFSRTAPPFPPVLTPEFVAERAMKALTKRTGPLVIPGFWNRVSAGLLTRLPRRVTIQIMSDTARKASFRNSVLS